MTPARQHWALAGPSGSGKSTVARLVAAAAGRRAIDLDDEVGQDTIAALLADGAAGEQALRRAEAAVLRRLTDGPSGVVVALGGGTLLGADSARVLAQPAWLVVWLDVPDAACVARCAADPGPARPLLQAAAAAGPEALAAFLQDRRAGAERATLRVDASGAAAEVARRVLAGLEQVEARRDAAS